jgi:hypothetical protein
LLKGTPRAVPDTLYVVLHEPTLSERVLDGDLVVRARHVQELLEVVPSRCGLGQVALGCDALRSTAAKKLSSRRRLSFFFFFLKREDVPLPWSMT